MEVKVIPLSGCMNVFMGILTLGIAPLAIKMQERRWPKSVGEHGLVTRGGKTIAWHEFTRAVKVISNVQGTLTERYDLHSSQGVVSIVVYRLENGSQVLEYVLDHLPEGALRPEA